MNNLKEYFCEICGNKFNTNLTNDCLCNDCFEAQYPDIDDYCEELEKE